MVRMMGLEPIRFEAGDFKSPVSAIPPHPHRVLRRGVEPPILTAADFKSAAYANSATSACRNFVEPQDFHLWEQGSGSCMHPLSDGLIIH